MSSCFRHSRTTGQKRLVKDVAEARLRSLVQVGLRPPPRANKITNDVRDRLLNRHLRSPSSAPWPLRGAKSYICPSKYPVVSCNAISGGLGGGCTAPEPRQRSLSPPSRGTPLVVLLAGESAGTERTAGSRTAASWRAVNMQGWRRAAAASHTAPRPTCGSALALRR